MSGLSPSVLFDEKPDQCQEKDENPNPTDTKESTLSNIGFIPILTSDERVNTGLDDDHLTPAIETAQQSEQPVRISLLFISFN